MCILNISGEIKHVTYAPELCEQSVNVMAPPWVSDLINSSPHDMEGSGYTSKDVTLL